MSTEFATTVEDVTSENFAEKIEQGKVLVDFYAPWCGPCKMLAPVLEQIAQENSDVRVIKVNADNNAEITAKYGVRGIPTLLLLNDGDLVATQVGAASVSQVKNFVSQH